MTKMAIYSVEGTKRQDNFTFEMEEKFRDVVMMEGMDETVLVLSESKQMWKDEDDDEFMTTTHSLTIATEMDWRDLQDVLRSKYPDADIDVTPNSLE